MSEPERGPLGGLRAPDSEGRSEQPPGRGSDPLGMPLAAADPLGGGLREGGEVRARAVCAVGVCDGSGWIIADDEEAHPCECRKRKVRRARVRGMQSTIPERYRGVSFERPPISDMAADPAAAAVVREIRDFCVNIDGEIAAGNGIWLYGGAGTGKTSLAMLISKTALEAGHSVAIYSMPRLLARIRRTYDADSSEEGYLAFFDRLASVDLLHIDDLGAEKRTDWVLEQLYAIVDRRYEERRSIVVTTNLETDELRAQIGDRTVSRLLQMCDMEKPLFGDDWRERRGHGPPPVPGAPG